MCQFAKTITQGVLQKKKQKKNKKKNKKILFVRDSIFFQRNLNLFKYQFKSFIRCLTWKSLGDVFGSPVISA